MSGLIDVQSNYIRPFNIRHVHFDLETEVENTFIIETAPYNDKRFRSVVWTDRHVYRQRQSKHRACEHRTGKWRRHDHFILGLRGKEDIGGGNAVFFALESFFSPNTGQMGRNTTDGIFSRNAYVGVTGAYGTFKFGEQTNPTCFNQILVNPFGASVCR
jgi:hypothetical protein